MDASILKKIVTGVQILNLDLRTPSPWTAKGLSTAESTRTNAQGHLKMNSFPCHVVWIRRK